MESARSVCVYLLYRNVSCYCSWSDYSTIGEVIPDARIIAFKTPLRSQFFKPGEDRFEVSNLLDEIHARGGELGLVVDLTYTTRYYDPEDFIRNGIEYQKIFCPGHDAEALRTIGAEFVDLLHWFFKKNAHNGMFFFVPH